MDLFLYDDRIRAWLAEDLPYGDVTSDHLFSYGQKAIAEMTARQDGVVAGLTLAERVFHLVSGDLVFKALVEDGEPVESGTILARISGDVRDLLKGERLALNLLGHLSGIATTTSRYVAAAGDYPVRIVDTRKTTPGLRALEKYAVRMGGGHNHRFNLSDGVMLKDNHIAAAGGIGPAVRRIRAAVSHTLRIEVEVETLVQYREALAARPDIIMLDNMSLEDMSQAVREKEAGIILEASGNVTLERVAAIAATGVDVISSGALTHSVESMDISMNLTAQK